MREVKMRAGQYMVRVNLEEENNRVFFHFKYNKTLIEEIKMMEGRKYHGFDEKNPRKIWSVPLTQRNIFQLEYLCGKNPYEPYDKELIDVTTGRPLRFHQKEFKAHALTRHYCVIAGDMGTGKTLAAIEVMEDSGLMDWIYVAPRSALRAIDLELEKWNCRIRPRMYTYEGMKKLIEDWPVGAPAPHGVIFDESSRLKTPTSQRSQAAQHLADGIRAEHGPNGFVILMSGTPAPKSPKDWWSQCEIACPGFLREGDIHKFTETLGIIVKKEASPGAGAYPSLETWRDSEDKCGICGKLSDDNIHDPLSETLGVAGAHKFQKGKNEVARLYNRLKGLVIVRMKKDCLDLPEKQYEVINLKPTQSVLNAAKFIKRRGRNAITTLTLLRELSDGFQYEDEEIGSEECSVCKGTKVYREFINPDDPSIPPVPGGPSEERIAECPRCNGTGEVVKTARHAILVPTPKEDLLKELLDKHDDIGRFVTYAGFTGSLDRVVGICHESKWSTIRVDGRGWLGQYPDGTSFNRSDFLKIFQNGQADFEKICFCGQPDAAGMGLTLTASPGIFYWSNSFNGEARIQSEDRIHRLGMDETRGATIYDCIHLPTDQYILDNLKQKRRLQDITMGQLDTIFAQLEGNDSRVF